MLIRSVPRDARHSGEAPALPGNARRVLSRLTSRTTDASHLPLDFRVHSSLGSPRHAERSKPDEQLRVHRRAHVNNRRFGCDQSAGLSRTRILSPQRKPARRSPHCPNARDAAAAEFAMVGHVQMEHRGELELRQVPCAHRLDHHAIHAYGFSLSA